MATRTELEELNVTDLRDLAAEAELEGRSKMTKAELVDALADDGPGDAPQEGESGVRSLDRLLGPDPDAEPAQRPTVPAGGIDPRLEETAKADRKREERPPRARPQAARIDPRLVDVRTRTIEEDRRSVGSATEPPVRG